MTGRIERPWRNRSREFLLGDPSSGDLRHHDSHAVKVDNYGEVLDLLERGFAIRMSDGTAPASLVTPASLTVVDEPVSSIDELWTFSMPDAPFSWEDVEQDLKAALLAQAGEIYWIANADAAAAFIGFPIDIDDIEHGSQAGIIDLGRFNLSRVAHVAYESAFRTGDRSLRDEDADELELLIGAIAGGPTRRYPSPIDRSDSPLSRTMLSAYLRWKISNGALFDNKLDQGAVDSLALLAGMSEQAVRNSLSKEGLSPVKGKLDYQAVMRWLEQRREFVPLREDERPEAQATWDAIHILGTSPLQMALSEIRGRNQLVGDSRALTTIEQRIVLIAEQGGLVPNADLRTYARHLGLAIDTLVLNFADAVAQAPSH
jgi:hypothetical protein